MKMKFFQVIPENLNELFFSFICLIFIFDLVRTFLNKYENIKNLKNFKEKEQKGGDPHLPYSLIIWCLHAFNFKRKHIH